MKKKAVIFILIIMLFMIPFKAYASDLSISSNRYIYSGDDWYSYGINVIIPGEYTVLFYVTNTDEEDQDDEKFEAYVDYVKVVEPTKIPWNEEKNEQVISQTVSLATGKHEFKIQSLADNWELNSFEFTLEERSLSGGSSVPGIVKSDSKTTSYGGTFENGYVYTNPGDMITYKIAVDKSGIYRVTAKAKYDGEDGNRIILRFNNAELGTIEYNNQSSGYVETSIEVDLPAGSHYLEVYNDDGHYSLESLNFSIIREKQITPIVRLTKDEFEKKVEDIDIKVDEEGLSVEDSTKRIEEKFDGILGVFTRLLFSLLQPIVDLFMGLLKVFLTDENGIIEKLFNIFIDLATFWIRMILFEGLLFLLRIIDALTSIFNIFAGTKPITVDGKSVIFINMLFEDTTIRNIFWGIFILGIALNLIFSIISVTRTMFSDDKENSIGQTLGKIGKSLATYVIVPIFVIFSINLSSVVLQKTDDIIGSSTSETRLTFGNTLFMILSFGEETSDYNDCTDNPSFTDDARITFYNDNTRYERSNNSSAYFDFSFFKIIGGIILCCYIILLLALAIIMFITRIFDLLLLFIVSPYFAASIALDGGEKFGEWRKMFIAKLVSGFGLVIMMKMFVSIALPVITNGSIVFSSNTIFNTGLMVLLLTGGCYAVFKSHNLLMRILNPQAALAEMGIAEVATGAAQEVANLLKSEAGGGKGGGASSGGLSDEQKNLLSNK